jgi:5-methylcytosine-specific restriction endonuclease McrA
VPYKDPEVDRQKKAERGRRRWARIKSDPELLRAHRDARAAHERARRKRDPYRGKSREDFLADCRRHVATRRARKLNQFIEEVDPQTVYAMHGGMCGICEQFIVGDFHVDHVVPLSKGGMHGYINVQPAHPICNRRKGDRV